MKNFKKLQTFILNLEEQNTYLFDSYRALADEINLFYADFQLINPDMIEEEESKEIFNYNFNIK